MSHGGNLRRLALAAGRPIAEILDFSANINPLGPPEWLRPVLDAQAASLAHYPDPDCTELREAAARRYGCSPAEVIAGNGSAELLYLAARAVGDHGLIPYPAYGDYTRACMAAGKPITLWPLGENTGFTLDCDALEAELTPGSLVFIGQPNNPTGAVSDTDRLRQMIRRHPDSCFVIDEAFADFVEDMESMTRNRPGNVIVMLSLTKCFAIAGLRLGLAVADRELIDRMRVLQPFWMVNTLAQSVGAAALRDLDYLARARAYVTRQRAELTRGLTRLNVFDIYAGQANFLLLRYRVPHGDASRLAAALLARGIAVRVCHDFAGLDHRFIRIAVRTEAENARLLAALTELTGMA